MKLFSTPINVIHGPRCMFHGSRARPACVGLCQFVSVCVRFVSVSKTYFSLYYHTLTQFCVSCVGKTGFSMLFETFFKKSLLFFKSCFDFSVSTQPTQTLQPLCTLVCSRFYLQSLLTQDIHKHPCNRHRLDGVVRQNDYVAINRAKPRTVEHITDINDIPLVIGMPYTPNQTA